MPDLPPIMIVDDDADDRFILRRLLAKAGVQNRVIAFDAAEPAMEYLQGESERPHASFLPCVVITDVFMPGRSGLDLARWIKAHTVLKRLRVIVTTESERPADEAAAANAGADQFVRKFPTSQGLRLLLGDLPCG